MTTKLPGLNQISAANFAARYQGGFAAHIGRSMSKKEVKCTVLGHGDGPACETCRKPMDTVRVESFVKYQGKKTSYCYHCSKSTLRVIKSVK